jgi:predicted 2-oxoglutarate/Fe(II)-dependent dioxygenase YbiX
MLVIIDDFIAGEDKRLLSELVASAKLTDLNHDKQNHKYSVPSKIIGEHSENENLYKLLSNYTENVGVMIEKCMGIAVLPEKDFSITVYSKGEMLHPHHDGMDDDFFKHKTPNGNQSRDVSSIIYLSDDYSGGLLKFPLLNVAIKPTTGCLIIFPSSQKYTHLVEEITDGLRHIVPQFWCKK